LSLSWRKMIEGKYVTMVKKFIGLRHGISRWSTG
jgi:hypothetical protein